MSDKLPTVQPRSRIAVRAKRDQQIRRIVSNLRVGVSHLDRPEYVPLLRSFARVTILIERAYIVLRDGGLTNSAGELRSSFLVLNAMISQQAKLAAQLGLSPAAFSKLKTAPPDDLAAALAGGR
jgi:hypothetical protein